MRRARTKARLAAATRLADSNYVMFRNMLRMNPHPNSPKKSWLKRRLIIDARLQLIFLAHSLSLLLTGMGLLWLHRYLMTILDIEGAPVFEINGSTIAYFSTGTALFFLLTLLQLELTNRVFGPIYRLKQHMRSVAKGEKITAFGTRKYDLMSDLNDAYNEVLHRLKQAEENAKEPVTEKGA